VQTVEILEKIDGLLGASGSHKGRILQATVPAPVAHGRAGVADLGCGWQIWLADMRFFTQMNAVWDAWVDQENAPARACVEVRLGPPWFWWSDSTLVGRRGWPHQGTW
jgi:hypothetical protein